LRHARHGSAISVYTSVPAFRVYPAQARLQ